MSTVILGAGNWGTVLSTLINPHQHVRLWCHTPENIQPVTNALRNISARDTSHISVESAFSSKLTSDDILILTLPSAQIEPVAIQLSQSLKPPYPAIISAAKGIKRSTFQTMSQVIHQILPQATIAVLTGPNIADEIAHGRPACAVLGCENVNALIKLSKSIASPHLHLQLTRDRVDIELCGAMKGVFAIGAGIINQKQMGANFLGLLLTAGLNEIAQIATFLGIQTTHVFGIAGMGDLIATCTSPNSRNYKLGQLLASGKSLQYALNDIGMVVEGAMTAAAVSEMATLRLNLPLFTAIANIIENPTQNAFEHFENTLLEYPISP